MKATYISNWEVWREICTEWKVDPYEYRDLSIGTGGGNSIDYEYIGDIPDKEE
jgi:hypothetical protein